MEIWRLASPWRQLLQTPAEALAFFPGLTEVLEQRPHQLEAEALRSWQKQLVEALLYLELPARVISQVLSDHQDALYCQVLEAELSQMAAHGWGAPPVAFCVVQLGSAGRSETLLRPDQDNAMLLAPYPDAEHTQIDLWFQHLAAGMNARLDQAGVPLCGGHVMACWPQWRKSVTSWQQQMQLWTQQPSVKKVQLSNILLDFHPVFGDQQLAKELRAAWLPLFPAASLFLHEMVSLLDEIPVALERWDRLRTGGEGAPHAQALNLKQGGLLPLQSSVRLLSLLAGVEAVSTHERLQALVAAGRLSRAWGQDLAQVLDQLMAFALNTQLQALQEGRQPDYWLDTTQLTPLQVDELKLCLAQLRDFVRWTQQQV
ncbi:DUF294 nucleotidyltransferase-like domain-containing protein [Marinospirillum sp. MEB164]|uniref:DUF294 nucleotidyltransferase-like domain-containing protein n=1 Tax=Marinospirillum alkalitolerans TaxID=3123374 RepID=A0ABW8PYQ6_9GAMM